MDKIVLCQDNMVCKVHFVCNCMQYVGTALCSVLMC